MSETVWTSDELAFVAIGEGQDKKGNLRVKSFEGRFVCSERRKIKGRMTTLHRFDTGSKGEVLVFGSGSVNNKLSKIPAGTAIRLTYLGMKDIGADSPMKDIKVEWPKGTILKSTATPAIDDEEEGDEPF